MLHSVDQVQDLISQGRTMLLAGTRWALSRLHRGQWIGGSTPYFMDESGGICSEDHILVTELPRGFLWAEVEEYQAKWILPSVYMDTPVHGYTFVIMPAGSDVHATYAKQAPYHPGLFEKPVAGWVSGVHVSRIGLEMPSVFNGFTGEELDDRAVALHVTLPHHGHAELEIVNVFEQGKGDAILFLESGFSATECMVNGIRTNFPAYLRATGTDPFVPLVGKQNGKQINVSIQGFDELTESIHFYAPVFSGIEYRFAKPLDSYEDRFGDAMRPLTRPAAFSCVCVLNYMYANLKRRRLAATVGPVTFGEIGHQLLNQTAVRLVVDLAETEKQRSPDSEPEEAFA